MQLFYINYQILFIMSINKAILVGNVGRDPEVRYLDKNVAVANFTMATTERGYTMQNGNQVPDRTEWHNVVAWRGLAELAEKYIRKGTQLYVEGKIQTRSWEKDGVKQKDMFVYYSDIVCEGYKVLFRGQKVSFKLGVNDAGKPKAVEVVVLKN